MDWPRAPSSLAWWLRYVGKPFQVPRGTPLWVTGSFTSSRAATGTWHNDKCNLSSQLHYYSLPTRFPLFLVTSTASISSGRSYFPWQLPEPLTNILSSVQRGQLLNNKVPAISKSVAPANQPKLALVNNPTALNNRTPTQCTISSWLEIVLLMWLATASYPAVLN
jgi:hypothetical protein